MTQTTPSTKAGPTARYDATMANAIETKWQDRWDREQTFHVPNPGEPGFEPIKGRPKQYILDMFPYPSGAGLHVGHPLGYIATDIYARYLRAKGYNVLHAMGFDAFGLPAEQYAVQTGTHPRVTTYENIETMQRQLRRLGLAHDEQRSFATTDVDYYQWTQWIFLQIFNSWFDPEAKNETGGAGRARPIDELIEEFESGKRSPRHGQHNPNEKSWGELDEVTRRRIVDDHRLAYIAEVPVNWCPELGTVLANEEVTAEGRSERGNHPVYKRPLKQWMMRITAYAERLLFDLGHVDWPEPIKLMQRNWIGRSEGATVDFPAGLESDTEVGTWFVRRRADGWTANRPKEEDVIRVFTTRPDTLFGATYMVLAPEHPLVDRLAADAWPAGTWEAWKGRFDGRPRGAASPREMVAAYRRFAESKSDVQRQESREKTGVFIGAYAINPVNRERIPIFIADYVLMGYGTGAIMAVPGHDERDFEFAKAFELPIVAVVTPPDSWFKQATADFAANRAAGDEQAERSVAELRIEYLNNPEVFPYAYTEYGVGCNSHNDEVSIDELATPEAKRVITEWLESAGLGQRAINYKLRDWLFSRQRYWGEPFPVVYDEHDLPVAVDESELPIELPDLEDFTPKSSDDPNAPPEPPLGRVSEWVNVERNGKRYRRELNTMPQWAGSCWYYLRYLDPKNHVHMVEFETERYWMLSCRGRDGSASRPEQFDPAQCHWGGVDLYVGGVEHAVLHLLYARFWHKVLFDLGRVSTPEPFGRLFNQGYIQAYAYTDKRGVYVPADEVEERDGRYFYNGDEVQRSYGKMGKSLKNATTPDDICHDYGADTLRVYEMYLGPLDQSKPWSTRDIIGSHRFLQRVWRNIVNEDTGETLVTEEPADEETRKRLHKTIAKVDGDMRGLSFNTAVAALIELNNALVNMERIPREVVEPLVQMVAPFAPHFGEELWERLGHESSITYEPFPVADERYLVEEEIDLVVQILGKVRGKVTVPADADEETATRLAKQDEGIAQRLEGKTIRKVVYVPGRLINFVAT